MSMSRDLDAAAAGRFKIARRPVGICGNLRAAQDFFDRSMTERVNNERPVVAS